MSRGEAGIVVNGQEVSTSWTPAVDMPRVAKETGAQVIEANPEPTPLTDDISDFIILAKAGVAMPQVVAEIKAMAS